MRKINTNTIEKLKICIKENFLSKEDYLTIRKIANSINIPYQTVGYYIKKLITSGELIKDERFGYNLKCFKENLFDSYRNIRVLGDIPCGQPDLANINTNDYIKLPNSILTSHNYFILKARGDSMINIGINNGDYVLVQEQEEACEGQVVVILSTEFNDSGVTLKRYYPELDRQRIRLHPENDDMEDIYIKVGKIQGIAKKVLKIQDIS